MQNLICVAFIMEETNKHNKLVNLQLACYQTKIEMVNKVSNNKVLSNKIRVPRARFIWFLLVTKILYIPKNLSEVAFFRVGFVIEMINLGFELFFFTWNLVIGINSTSYRPILSVIVLVSLA